MRYVGSKSRHAKHFLPLLLRDREPDQHWVEPFVGGGNVICRVDGPRLGSDANRYVVELLKAVRDGWEPPESVSEEQYLAVKAEPDKWPAALVGFVGTQCTFGSNWFGSYAKVGKVGPARNFAREGRDNLLRQREGLVGAELVSGDYRALSIPPRSIVYCDPPYAVSLGYKGAGAEFDSAEFWRWCSECAAGGHSVYVSEYSAPEGWRCIWERETAGFHAWTPGGNVRKRPVERLFTLAT